MNIRRIEKSRIAALAAAVLICVGGAFSLVRLFDDAPRKVMQSGIAAEAVQLPEVSKELRALGGGEDTAATGEGDSHESDSFAESESSDNISSDNTQHQSGGENKQSSTDSRSDTDSSGVKNSGTGGASGRAEGTGESPDNSKKQNDEKKSNDDTESSAARESSDGGKKESGGNSGSTLGGEDTALDVPEINIPSDTKDDGGRAAGEYFTTSINDGETVSERDYFFTVTHLDDSLTPREVTVEINGSTITQFAGKCRLEENENKIRVTCSYTDKEGAVVRAFKDYTVYLRSESVYIITDLENITVYEEELTFEAHGYCGDEELAAEVYLNGSPVYGEGSYSVSLSEGENTVTLTAEKDGRTAQSEYTIIYIAEKEFRLVTDLYDSAVYGKSFAFTAYTTGGSAQGKLTVQLNGVTIKGENGSYSCELEYGENRIRLIAKNGGESIEQSYNITCLPEYSEEELPGLESVSIYDGMEVKGSALTVILKAADCDGSRIYSGKIQLYCNSQLINRSWEDAAETGYVLPLTNGDNSVYICLTDSLGRVGEYYYTVRSSSVSQGEETARISISCEAENLGLGYLCSDSSFPVYEGESGFDTLVRFLEENGFTVYSRGADTSRYLYRIEKPGAFAAAQLTDEARAYMEKNSIPEKNSGSPDSLGEFDYTQGSGWIYTRNGKVPSYTMSSAVFGEGEQIRLIFSLDYGADVRSGG